MQIALLVAVLLVGVNAWAQDVGQPVTPDNPPTEWDEPGNMPPADSKPAEPPAVLRPDGRGPMPHAALLRAIAQERPELAERLRRLWRESPEKFREVVVRSLAAQLEVALDEAERVPARPGPAGRPPGERPPRPAGPAEEDERQLRQRRELEQRHEQLEDRTRDLVNRLRQLRAEGGPAEASEGTERELREVVNAQFEVRTQLRRLELERIEQNLRRLQQMLERMRQGLEHRERARGAIIDRRVEQLTGEGLGDW
jgi:hypothetical protein